jgi:hypothetical protein
MNKMPERRNAARRRLILWLAQMNAVLVMTVLAWALPSFAAVEPVPGVRAPLLIAALVALPLALVAGRWLMARARGGPRPPDPRAGGGTTHGVGGRDDAGSGQTSDSDRAVGFSVLAWTVCELPLVLGFVYALLGGERLHAVALGGASMALLLLFRPSASG